jgi:predicted RNA methylase
MNQDIGLSRNTIDKYYTSKCAVEQCMSRVVNHININADDLCIEPSAGNGSFIEHIKLLFENYRLYDLDPDHSEIIKQDYLTLDYTNLQTHEYNKIHIVGNPPFGRQSSLAIKFIKKSCEYCDSISFILPKSFKKESMKKHFPLKFHLIHEYDMPNNSFIVGESIHDVPCVFQIWRKLDEKRIVPAKLIPKNYKFIKQDEDPDISFRRVGGKAGTIDRVFLTKSPQSHYFIKFDDPLTETMFQTLNDIVYQCKNYTVGPRSISKQELIKEFNMIL